MQFRCYSTIGSLRDLRVFSSVITIYILIHNPYTILLVLKKKIGHHRFTYLSIFGLFLSKSPNHKAKSNQMEMRMLRPGGIPAGISSSRIAGRKEVVSFRGCQGPDKMEVGCSLSTWFLCLGSPYKTPRNILNSGPSWQLIVTVVVLLGWTCKKPRENIRRRRKRTVRLLQCPEQFLKPSLLNLLFDCFFFAVAFVHLWYKYIIYLYYI